RISLPTYPWIADQRRVSPGYNFNDTSRPNGNLWSRSPVSASLPFYLPLATVLIQGRLDSRLQPALVVVVESDELERLKTPGFGTQHFGRALHRSPAGQKHHLYLGALVQGFRQAEQATGERDDLQFASYATTVLASK